MGAMFMPVRRIYRLRTAIFTHDLIMVPLAWMGAYWLRFNLGVIPVNHLNIAIIFLPAVTLIQAIVFHYYGLYRGVWRFASVPDLLRIAKGVIAGIIIIAVGAFFYNRLHDVPRSVIPLYTILLFLMLSGPRIIYRLWKDYVRMEGSGQRALVVGAGMGGEMLVRDLLREHTGIYSPVAFVDDDINKRKREVHGVRVVGSTQEIPAVVADLEIEIILIAVPSATDEEMRRIVEICESCKLPFLTLPSVKDLLSGGNTRQTLRDVQLEDLLGRKPVRLEWQIIRDRLESTCILVTGGGGSIGSELCKQIARLRASKLIIFEQSEFNLYKIESELIQQFPGLVIESILGNVRDKLAVEKVVTRYKPDMIFHAAAYKHVPLLQDQLREAALNNVIGTKVVADAAIKAGVRRFVLISTDKAVNPGNIMGACKRAAEVLCQSLDGTAKTKFITVRFGNVLDSAGSVVPLFREQIENGGPVTVTHPDITRYFMTIPESCQLILQAATVGRGGEVFVLDMGVPIKISYLAEQLIQLSGRTPGVDINIEYIGLRPGEKMYEELFHENENLTPTGHSKLLLAQSRQYRWEYVTDLVSQLEDACFSFNDRRIYYMLKKLVPEFAQVDEHIELENTENDSQQVLYAIR